MEKTVQIQNLKCSGCGNSIIKGLMKVNGVQNVTVHTKQSTISLSYENEAVYENVRTKLSKIGYPVKGDENNVRTKATSYVSCAIGKVSK